MTIRYTCAGCGSLLKIKDDLAGTDGKCPKCKLEFVVPEPESAVVSAADSAEIDTRHSHAPAETKRAVEEPAEKTVTKSVAKSATKPKKRNQDDFDPAEFLMGDGDDAPPLSLSDTDLESPPSPPKETRHPVEASPRRSMGKAPTPGGAGLETGSGISASSFAKEMMKKAMDESRLHAGDMPEEEDKGGGFDWSGFAREFGVKGVGGLVFGIVLTYGLYLFFDNMMGGRLKLPKLGYVTGEVKLDGKPLEGATVYFAPTDATIADSKRERPRTSYGVVDAAGHYSLIYIGTTKGVAVGKCRIWIECIGPKGDVVPAEFSQANLSVRDVKPGSQEFSFDLKSAK